MTEMICELLKYVLLQQANILIAKFLLQLKNSICLKQLEFNI
jgi:hypothetical protein